MYVPYFVATAIMSAIYFIIMNLVFSQSVSNLSYGPTITVMFSFGLVVMSFFTVGYMLYINSFLIKRRKKEFGLYGVLGLEKRHVGRVILWENLTLDLSALMVGLVAGCVFGRLVFLLLLKVLDVAPDSTFRLSSWAFCGTVLIFLVIFLISTLYNLFQVQLANPIDLLQGEKKGEKKVRFVLPITIVGVVLLGTAYYLSITSASAAAAVVLFWPAVLMVIAATWCLFTAGSVFCLTLLKNNKRFYYKSSNFVAVSGLLHRLKQNAAGLSNICILSTMVIVTMSICSALFVGQEDILRRQNPNDIEITYRSESEQGAETVVAQTQDAAAEWADYYQVTVTDQQAYDGFYSEVALVDGEIVTKDQQGVFPFDPFEREEWVYQVRVISQAAYNAVCGAQVSLAADEMLWLTNDPVGIQQVAMLGEDLYYIQGIIADTPFTLGKNGERQQCIVMVVADENQCHRLLANLNPTVTPEPGGIWHEVTFLSFNVEGADQACLDFSKALTAAFTVSASQNWGEHGGYQVSDIYASRQDAYALFGGLLFLGAFFTILFLTNTVLIIYFKQISEGFDDRERFEILQKVGMSDREVKKTINKQILIVFFLPLLGALIHTAAASNMMIRMLQAFSMYNISLTMLCVFVTSIIFAVVYALVYRFTARTYYKLVKW